MAGAGLIMLALFWAPGSAFCREPVMAQDLGAEVAAVRALLAAELPDIRKTLKNRLDKIQIRLDRLLSPTWEYKVVVPNLLNSPGSEDEGIFDGVDFNAMGLKGWELINYSDNYGFVFKRRVK